jgi:hypothetical protein
MCGTTGEIIEGGKTQARQYKREKIDEQTRAGQDRFGQATGDLYESGTMAMEDSREIIRRNTESLPGTAGPYQEEEDTSTSEANYSSTGQTQTSSGTGKKADLGDTDKKDPKGASANLTVRKKKPKGETA